MYPYALEDLLKFCHNKIKIERKKNESGVQTSNMSRQLEGDAVSIGRLKVYDTRDCSWAGEVERDRSRKRVECRKERDRIEKSTCVLLSWFWLNIGETRIDRTSDRISLGESNLAN